MTVFFTNSNCCGDSFHTHACILVFLILHSLFACMRIHSFFHSVSPCIQTLSTFQSPNGGSRLAWPRPCLTQTEMHISGSEGSTSPLKIAQTWPVLTPKLALHNFGRQCPTGLENCAMQSLGMNVLADVQFYPLAIKIYFTLHSSSNQLAS